MLAFKRFADLYERLSSPEHPVSSNAAEKIYDALMNAYTAPARAYHNVRHLSDCLDQFDAVRTEFVQSNKAEFALWFHDAVFDSRVKDNEERSARWAGDVLAAGGASGDAITLVESFILATRHRVLPGDPDAKLIIDIDLSILGRDEATFDAYDAAIRKEYDWVAEDQYRLGRSSVLRGFLKRDRVYQTEFFWARYEKQARKNMERAIAKLDAAK